MSDILISICDKLGVLYPDINNYSGDCAKAEYLLNQISEFIGG